MKASASVHVSQWVYPVAAVMLLTVPLRWLLAAAVSGLFHELCHLTVIRLLGYRVFEIRIGVGGAVIRTGAMPPVQELLCTAAGPLGGLLLLLFVRRFPCTAVCAGVQTVFNLLPVFPMDGGRILHCCRSLGRK